jgi:vancomycin permeability regulator SanA
VPKASATRSPRWSLLGEVVLAAGAAGLVVVGASVAYVRAAARGHVFDPDDVPAAPVALVLGAAVFPDGRPSPFLAARLDLARRLYVAGKAEVLLVSGDNLAPEYDEPAAMRRYLVDAGVPSAAIVTDHAGFDTYDSCFRAARVFGVRRLIVVTQAYHLPRAVGTARRLGLEAAGVGDETARQFAGAWRRGTVRDLVACVKTVVDLAVRRTPVLGAPSPGVTDALRSA